MDKEELVEVLRPMIRNRMHLSGGIDIDETLAEVHEIMIEDLYNKAKGTHYRVEDHTDWDFRSIGSNYVEMMGFYVETWKNHHDRIPFIGNLETIRELSQYVLLDEFTARSVDDAGVTAGTLPGLYAWRRAQQLDYLPIVVSPEQINKIEFRYPMLFDDSPRLAARVEENGSGILFLVDKPYNRDIKESKRVFRVADVNVAFGALLEALRCEGSRKMIFQTPIGLDWVYGRRKVA
jgi:hypothetical protein